MQRYNARYDMEIADMFKYIDSITDSRSVDPLHHRSDRKYSIDIRYLAAARRCVCLPLHTIKDNEEHTECTCEQRLVRNAQLLFLAVRAKLLEIGPEVFRRGFVLDAGEYHLGGRWRRILHKIPELRGALAKARDAFLAVLDKHTLADLVRPRAPLQKLLSVKPDGKAVGQRLARRA